MTGDLVIEVQAPKLIPEGQHTGTIKSIEVSERKQGVVYIDVFVTCDGSDAILRAGYPQSSSPKTLLGKLLTRFGANMKAGSKVSVNKILKPGSKVSYQTQDDETERGTFSRIIRDTLKPR